MAQKTKLSLDLESAVTYMAELEDKVFVSNKLNLELLEKLRDAECEIETLKQYVIDLKSRIAVYIPVKGDAIDNKLAEYINNYPDR